MSTASVRSVELDAVFDAAPSLTDVPISDFVDALALVNEPRPKRIRTVISALGAITEVALAHLHDSDLLPHRDVLVPRIGLLVSEAIADMTRVSETTPTLNKPEDRDLLTDWEDRLTALVGGELAEWECDAQEVDRWLRELSVVRGRASALDVSIQQAEVRWREAHPRAGTWSEVLTVSEWRVVFGVEGQNTPGRRLKKLASDGDAKHEEGHDWRVRLGAIEESQRTVYKALIKKRIDRATTKINGEAARRESKAT